MKKTRFGVFLPFYAFYTERSGIKSPFDRLRHVVLECEKLGFDSVWIDDHLMFGKEPILECWTTLSALSSVTSKIRLGSMVLCNSFRSPTVLAKMAATLDLISNGRLELGIGAGVQEDEHKAYGLPFLKPIARIDQMKETVEILKKLWTEETASYQGKYYKMSGASCEPKPIQKPYPPIIIGGGGEKFTLRVTALHAIRYDWGYVPSLDVYKRKLEVLKGYCKAVGRDFDDIEKATWLGGQIFIVPNLEELDKKVAKLKPANLSIKDFKKTNFIATPSQCIREIRQYKRLGVTYFMLFFGELPNMSSPRLFAEEVIKKMKK